MCVTGTAGIEHFYSKHCNLSREIVKFLSELHKNIVNLSFEHTIIDTSNGVPIYVAYKCKKIVASNELHIFKVFVNYCLKGIISNEKVK